MVTVTKSCSSLPPAAALLLRTSPLCSNAARGGTVTVAGTHKGRPAMELGSQLDLYVGSLSADRTNSFGRGGDGVVVDDTPTSTTGVRPAVTTASYGFRSQTCVRVNTSSWCATGTDNTRIHAWACRRRQWYVQTRAPQNPNTTHDNGPPRRMSPTPTPRPLHVHRPHTPSSQFESTSGPHRQCQHSRCYSSLHGGVLQRSARHTAPHDTRRPNQPPRAAPAHAHGTQGEVVALLA